MTREWTWRKLAEAAGERPGKAWRAPEYIRGTNNWLVRTHCDYPTTPAVERFIAMTERVLIGDDTCIVFTGGATFRVDAVTVTTPARFYWREVCGLELERGEVLEPSCLTAGCVKHREKK